MFTVSWESDVWIPFVFVLRNDGRTPVEGKTYANVTCRYVKSGSTSFVSKLLTSSNFREIGGGFYEVKFTELELDTVGLMKVELDCDNISPVREILDVSRVIMDRVATSEMLSQHESLEATHRSQLQSVVVNGVYWKVVDKTIVYDKALTQKTFYKRGEVGVTYSVVVTGLAYDPTEAVVKFSMRLVEDPLHKDVAWLDGEDAEILEVVELDSGLYECVLRYTFQNGDLDRVGSFGAEFALILDDPAVIHDVIPDEGYFSIEVLDVLS